MALMAVILGLGLLFYIPLGFRYSYHHHHYHPDYFYCYYCCCCYYWYCCFSFCLESAADAGQESCQGRRGRALRCRV